MDSLTILAYGSMAILALLLIIFEIRDARIGKSYMPNSVPYAFYTESGECVHIRKMFGSNYRVYADGNCPVPLRRDRRGNYFSIRAHSAPEAEAIVDEIYRGGVC